jgi:arylsulfatase A-like enzyme
MVKGSGTLPGGIRRHLKYTTAAAAVVAALSTAGVLKVGSQADDRRRPGRSALPDARPRPDIVLITIDALRADHVAAYGYRRPTSPALDRLATQSIVFTNAITQAPYTKAAVASLMSGLYPASHKTVTVSVPFVETMTGVITTPPPRTDVLPSSIVTLAETLHDAGYQTLAFTANPFLIAPFGFAQGFDRFEFFPGSDFADGSHVVDAALKALENEGPSPVFLWLHLMEPHSPYVPPPWTRGLFPLEGRPQPLPPGLSIPPWLIPGSPRDLRSYEASYDEDVAAADVAVDVFLRDYSELRDASDTVVVVTADHGEEFLDHGGWEHNSTLYEELIRVPLLVRAPGVAASVIQDPVQLIDLYPTLVELGRAVQPSDLPGHVLPGVSADAEPEVAAFAENPGAQYAVRTADWKLIMWADGRQALFDLRHDRRERHDVAMEQPATVERLRRTMNQFIARAVSRGSRVGPETAPVDPRVLEQLKSLGYLGR